MMTKRTSNPPIVRNIAELRERVPKGELLVHFTKEQWERLIRKAKPGKAVPKRGGRLEFTPDPNGDGTARFVCNPGPGEECSYRVRRDPSGAIDFECRCKLEEVPTPSGGGGGRGGRLTPPDCVLRVDANGVLGCLRVACSGRCEQRRVRVGNRYVVYCACA